jgi:hypothetical protein
MVMYHDTDFRLAFYPRPMYRHRLAKTGVIGLTVTPVLRSTTFWRAMSAYNASIFSLRAELRWAQ